MDTLEVANPVLTVALDLVRAVANLDRMGLEREAAKARNLDRMTALVLEKVVVGDPMMDTLEEVVVNLVLTMALEGEAAEARMMALEEEVVGVHTMDTLEVVMEEVAIPMMVVMEEVTVEQSFTTL